MTSRGVTVWFTGLSGAGKSTLAREVAAQLRRRGLPVEILDGDDMRRSLCRDLGFTPDDRRRNVERVSFVAGLLARHGVITLVALIAPYRDARERAKREVGSFLEVYVRAPLEVLVERDVKGLYRQALAGKIQGFTGVTDPYEEPEHPDLICDTHRESVAESAQKVIRLLEERGYIPRWRGADDAHNAMAIPPRGRRPSASSAGDLAGAQGEEPRPVPASATAAGRTSVPEGHRRWLNGTAGTGDAVADRETAATWEDGPSAADHRSPAGLAAGAEAAMAGNDRPAADPVQGVPARPASVTVAAARRPTSPPATADHGPERPAPGTVPGPSEPHGGTLVWRTLTGDRRQEALERAASLPRIRLDELADSDLELIGVGALSPLTGFLGRADYQAVVEAMRLANGLVWSLPVTLAVSRQEAARLREGDEVALVDDQERPLGLMQVTDIYDYDKEKEAQRVFGTTDAAHPGVARLYRRGDVLLGGPVWFLGRPGEPLPVGPEEPRTETTWKATGESDPGGGPGDNMAVSVRAQGGAAEPRDRQQAVEPQGDPFRPYRLTPWQTRRLIAQRGWHTVVGFQTRNPVHRAHEYLQKVALEMVDGLLLHPLVGPTKADDVPAPVRLRCYLELLRLYYPQDRVLFSVFPAAMRYAGPREALFHALCRKNYGCTHFIVGRDHAGVGNYYGTYDAQRLLDRFTPGELGIVPLKFEHAFYCRRCQGMATTKTCPHGEDDRVILSGTRVRSMLAQGQLPPPEFTRPEVAQILVEAARGTATTDLGR